MSLLTPCYSVQKILKIFRNGRNIAKVLWNREEIELARAKMEINLVFFHVLLVRPITTLELNWDVTQTIN